MFFKKKKQNAQAEPPSIATAPVSPQGQSVFAPGLNPTPAHIDFGFGDVGQSPPPAKYSSVSDISAYPQPPAFSPEPASEGWASQSPEAMQAAPGGWASSVPVSVDAQPLPGFMGDMSEPAPMPSPTDAFSPGISGHMPTPDWASPAPLPEPPASYSTSTFEDYIPQPAAPESLDASADFLPWQESLPTIPITSASEEPASFGGAELYELPTPQPLSAISAEPMSDLSGFSDNPDLGAFNANLTDFQHASSDAFWNSEPSPSGGQALSMDPAAFLDSVNEQLYPSDPFHSEQSDLIASEQAFEEAAQFLFPETMGAPLEWSDEHEQFSLESPMLLGQDAPFGDASLDLGPSFQTEAAGFNDISSIEEEPDSFATFETPTPGIELPATGPVIPVASPEEPIDLLQTPEAMDWAAGSTPGMDALYSNAAASDAFGMPATEEVAFNLDEADTFITPTSFSGEELQEMANALEFPDISQSANEPFLPAAEIHMSTENSDTFGAPLSGAALTFEDADFEQAFTATDDVVATYELTATTTEISPPALEPTSPELAMPLEPTTDSLWLPDETPLSESTGSWELPLSPPEAPELSTITQPPLQPQPEPFVAEHPDDDFYAVSFSLNELGEVVPEGGQAASPLYIDEPALPPLSLDEFSSGPPTEELPEAAQPGAESFETAASAFASFIVESAPPQAVPPQAAIPAMHTQQPTLEIAAPPVPPTEMAPQPLPEPIIAAAASTANAAEASMGAESSPPAEPPQPRRIQPKPLIQRSIRIPAPEPALSPLEAEWENQPEIKPTSPPSQPKASELMLGNLDIVSVCPLTPEKRLIIIQNGAIYALMGQVGLEQPQISVLKVFDHNPIAYQNTFTAVEEGQAGHQGMYVVQVGTWHGIISTFQDKITLHTELG